jgi:predicted O-methyltransferase YrrM
MFHDIPEAGLQRMRYLEGVDMRDRGDGTPHGKRLRQISAEVGRLLAILAASAPAGDCVEIGTSAGYSTLWLAFACKVSGRRLRTFEFDAGKAALARETFRIAGLESFVELVEADVRAHLPAFRDIGFCFLDAEKDIYTACYEAVVPNLARGGLLVADNITSHAEALRPVVERAMADKRIDAVVVPIGGGELVCRKI